MSRSWKGTEVVAVDFAGLEAEQYVDAPMRINPRLPAQYPSRSNDGSSGHRKVYVGSSAGFSFCSSQASLR